MSGPLTTDDICEMARSIIDNSASDRGKYPRENLVYVNIPQRYSVVEHFALEIVPSGNQNAAFEASFPHFCTQEIVPSS